LYLSVIREMTNSDEWQEQTITNNLVFDTAVIVINMHCLCLSDYPRLTALMTVGVKIFNIIFTII